MYTQYTVHLYNAEAQTVSNALSKGHTGEHLKCQHFIVFVLSTST